MSLPCVEESEALFHALGHRWGIAWTLWIRGAEARDRGDVSSACALLEESLGLYRDLGDRMGATVVSLLLGHISRDQDDRARAHAIYMQTLAAFQEMGSDWGCVHAVEALAVLAKREGNLERAARLWGAAAAVRKTLGGRVPPLERPHDDPALPETRAALGDAAFAAAWEAGRAMRIEEAVAYALEPEGAPPAVGE